MQVTCNGYAKPKCKDFKFLFILVSMPKEFFLLPFSGVL